MKYNKISTLLSDNHPNLIFLSIMTGVISGVCFALIIPLVLYALTPQDLVDKSINYESIGFFNSPNSKLAMLFLINCFLILVTKSASVVINNYVAQYASVSLRVSLYKKIRELPIATIERLGPSKLITLLNADVMNAIAGALSIPNIWISCITVLGLLCYLAYLNVSAFVYVLGALAVGVITFQIPMIIGEHYMKKSRAKFDDVQEGIRGLIYGSKELKLNDARADEFHELELVKNETEAANQYIKGGTIINFAIAYGDLITFFVIGIAVFHLPYKYDLSSYELTGLVMALMYITGPVAVVLNSLPIVSRGRVALNKILDICEHLDPETLTNTTDHDYGKVESVKIRDINYKYVDSHNSETFRISDICLDLYSGAVTYIVGGNGSGKSTLAKILSLHYIPDSGEIYFNGICLDSGNYRSARNRISSIYSDYYLFSKIYDLNSEKVDIAKRYLRYLDLDEKVAIENSRFTTTKLSDGQRKRLALLVSLLEDRDIYLFDEWASDQDPKFKKFFYNVVLGDLKNANKIVIVVTHDDAYFNKADKIIFMEDGKIRNISDGNIRNSV